MQYSAATVVLIVLLVVVANIGATPHPRPPGLPEDDAAPLLSQWTSFQRQYDKHYSSPTETSFRRRIFADNLRRVESHNRAADRRETTYRMAINHLSDRLANERPACFRHAANSTLMADAAAAKFQLPPGFRLPAALDWRKRGAVTGVKTQGGCKSCWAFSATGGLEGQHFRKTGQLVSLSEQNLVDCSHGLNEGCRFGGYMYEAFTYVTEHGGIDTEEAYPYEAKDGRCRFKASEVGATARGFVMVEKNNEAKLLEAVASIGPISVGIDASDSFYQYSSGVFYDKQCSSNTTDHGVLVVGYGRDEATGADYWLVKNSWGPTWGDHGYIKMARNRDNNCCIVCDATYPLM